MLIPGNPFPERSQKESSLRSASLSHLEHEFCRASIWPIAYFSTIDIQKTH